MIKQARLAAVSGVGIDTVLRRYFAGFSLLNHFLIEEAGARGGLDGVALKRLSWTQSANLDRLIEAIGAEHARARAARPGTAEERRAAIVKGLLDGERLDASELAYELESSTHLALVIEGLDAGPLARKLAAALDKRLLMVQPDGGRTWAWLGGRSKIERAELDAAMGSLAPPCFRIAFGAQWEGLEGWRLSHRQARAALLAAPHRAEPFVHYADVAMFVCALSDDLLAISLRGLYIDPLKRLDGGVVLIDTLQAYLRAECNMSSAAAALGVNRKTVNSRLRTVEEVLGGSLAPRLADMEIALRVEDAATSGSIARAPRTVD